jgi:hypothetical protein
LKDSDKKFEELMHAEMDGEASEIEVAALHEYLVSKPEARAIHTQLGKLAGILNQIPDIEPPKDLRRKILANLPPPRPAIDSALRGKLWHIRFPVLRYGYALAAGLLLGMVLSRVAFRNLSFPDTSDFYGAMIAREGSPALDQMKLDLGDLSGSVGLTQSNENALIVFDLNSRQLATIVVTFDADQIGFGGFSHQPKTVGWFSAEPGRITFKSEGTHHSTLLLARRKNVEIILGLEFDISDKLVHHGTLRLPKTR